MANTKVLRSYGTHGRGDSEYGAVWVDLPAPVFRKVHRLGDTWAQGGTYDIRIAEVQYPTTALLSITQADERALWIAVENLMGLVQLYLDDGWTLVHFSDQFASLRKPTPKKFDTTHPAIPTRMRPDTPSTPASVLVEQRMGQPPAVSPVGEPIPFSALHTAKQVGIAPNGTITAVAICTVLDHKLSDRGDIVGIKISCDHGAWLANLSEEGTLTFLGQNAPEPQENVRVIWYGATPVDGQEAVTFVRNELSNGRNYTPPVRRKPPLEETDDVPF